MSLHTMIIWHYQEEKFSFFYLLRDLKTSWNKTNGAYFESRDFKPNLVINLKSLGFEY